MTICFFQILVQTLCVVSWNSGTKNGKSPIYSKGKIINNLLSQTITLWFNIRTSTNLGGFVMTASFTTAKLNCSTGAVNYDDKKSFTVTSKLVGKSVNTLLELANKALGNSSENDDNEYDVAICGWLFLYFKKDFFGI